MIHPSRRKLGSTNSSTTDVRKTSNTADPSRPRNSQTMARKSAPQTQQKRGKSPRASEKEQQQQQQQQWPEDERESFPQFCMTCEKQFSAQDERFPYCSEACRKKDQSVATSLPSPEFKTYETYSSGSLPYYNPEATEIRDIIPRASPSRPSSNYFSPPTTPTNSQFPSAISALRSLNLRPPSPPSSLSMSSVWPFTRSAATSPNSSYLTNMCPSTYDGGNVTSPAYGAGIMSPERPLPSRTSPSYSRPKSIALVTPMMSRY